VVDFGYISPFKNSRALLGSLRRGEQGGASFWRGKEAKCIQHWMGESSGSSEEKRKMKLKGDSNPAT